MSSLKPKLLYQLAVTFLYTAAPLIIFPYISRVLGPQNIGRINFIDYAAQFFILLASFGIPFYGVREVARVRNQKEKLSTLSSELVIIHLAITVVSLLLFGLLVFLRHDQFTEKELTILAIINISTSALGFEWLIHGLEDFSFLAKRSFIIKILSLIAIFIFVRNASGYILYYSILIGSNLILLITDLSYVLRKNIRFRGRLNLKRHIRPLSIFFLTTVALSLYTFFDTVILGLIAGSLAVGFYTTALKIIRLGHNLISDLGGVLLPRVSFLVESGETTEVSRIINKSLHYVFTITVPLGLFIYLAAQEIIFVIGGEKFSDSIPVLRILSVMPVIIGLTNIFFIQILLPHREERVMLAGVLLGSVVSIVSNIILCPLYAQKGAAVSCLAAEFVVALFLGIRALKKVKLYLPVGMMAGILLSGILFIPIVWLSRNMLTGHLLVLTVSALACFMVFSLVQLLLFRNEIVKEMFVFLGGKIFRQKAVLKDEL